MKKAFGISLIGLLIAWGSAQASPVFRDGDAAAISGGEGTVSLDVEFSDVVVFVLASFPCTEGLTVTSVLEDHVLPLDKQDADGCLECMARAELFADAPSGSFTIPFTVTLSASAAGEAVGFSVSGAYQDPPLADFSISVGKGIADEAIVTPDADATVLVVFSDSDTITVSTPAGFVSELNTVLSTDVRVVIFSDMDSSEATAALSFSAPVEYIAYALGIDND